MKVDITDGIESGNLLIKIVVANEVSATLLTDEKFNGKVVQPGPLGGALLGEHGFAALIKAGDNNYLFDTGGYRGTVLDNTKTMNIKLNEIDKLIISHGHIDHTGSLMRVIPNLKEGCELILNPSCYNQTYIAVTRSGEDVDLENFNENIIKLQEVGKLKFNVKLPELNRDLVHKTAKENNVKVIETSKPLKIHDGITTSGEIQLFDPEEATHGFYLLKGKNKAVKNTFREETSIYFNVKGKGLVALTGCGHTGILNTIKHGQTITGIEKVYAAIGGFHEEWNSLEQIRSKIRMFKEINPEIVCGLHCTGFKFNAEIAGLPFHTLGIVGTEFHL
ncbi:MAG: MBL fold metallo-hydrolase [Promethearchaeota archaeon]